VLVAVLGPAMSLLLAVFADRVVKAAPGLQDAADLALRGGAGGGRRAVAVHVCALDRRGGVLLRAVGFDWNHLLNGNHAMTLIVMAAVWKQISYNFLFFLAGCSPSPSR
jgi:sn-glycerol 3-phosphate transport system permease protein